MATRKSSRLEEMEAKPDPVPIRPAPVKKRKTSANADSNGTKNQKKPKAMASADGAKLGLSSLPQEILDLTVKNLGDPKSVSALGRTCKALYDLMMPRLYQRVAAAAMFHAHIAKLIRTLQPHLTIAQSKQLIKEGKYKGQPAKHVGGVDPNAAPHCASYVRDVVIGVCDPGKKHVYIVERYIEEALKNFANVESVQAWTLTEPIAEQIASMAKLKALWLHMRTFEEESENLAGLLKNIKGLEHLHITDQDWGVTYMCNDVLLSMLANSRLTLKSLEFHVPRLPVGFLSNWKQLVSTSGRTSEGKYDFPQLKTFEFGPLMIDEEALQWLQGIDFVDLQELSLNTPRDVQGRLANHVTEQITSTLAAGRQVRIRDLKMNMVCSDSTTTMMWHTTMADKAQLDAKIRLIGSFGTLEKVSLLEYGLYRDGAPNPSLDKTLLDSIFKHSHLRVLHMTYSGIKSQLSIPYLKENDVNALLRGLPELEEFTFAPQVSTKEEADGIARSLVTGRNLRVVDLFTLEFRETDTVGSILQEYLAAADVPDGESFVWEDHYKLRRIITYEHPCEIASKFGKIPKGGKKSKTETASRDVGGKMRQVQHRGVPRHFSIHVGYDDEFLWFDKIKRPMYRRAI